MKLKLLLGTLVCSTIAFAQVPSYVPTNGLVGWWPFNGNANDESSNTNDGTVNGATLTTDRNSDANSAYNFNGTSDFIQIPNDASLAFGGNEISISVWVNIASYPGNATYGKIAISKQSGDGTTQSGLNVNYKSGSHGMLIKNGSGGNFGGASNPQAINLSTWTHIVYVWDGSNGFCYENGVMVNSGSSTGAAIGANTVPLLFGKPNWSNVNAEPFAGKLDDIAIYNRPLSTCEIQDLYTSSTNSLTGVSQSGALLESEVVSAQYQWLDCDDNYSVINGETNQSYTPANSGNYAVEVTLNGCVDTSACYLVDYTGIEEFNNSNFSLFPNPANQSINIQSSRLDNVTITNLFGQIVFIAEKNHELVTIDVSAFSSGTYFIRQNNSVVKFIIQ